jgi:hypothetical protein
MKAGGTRPERKIELYGKLSDALFLHLREEVTDLFFERRMIGKADLVGDIGFPDKVRGGNNDH